MRQEGSIFGVVWHGMGWTENVSHDIFGVMVRQGLACDFIHNL